MMRHWEEAEEGLQGLEHLPLKDFQRAARGLKAEGTAMRELGLQLRFYSLCKAIEFYSRISGAIIMDSEGLEL